MIHGIAIMGLNGCGKSTLTNVLSKKIGFYEMDVEDYYFPEQKHSRKAVLEKQYNAPCEYKGELPYSMPRSSEEVQKMIWDDINLHPQFVICGVTMNWNEEILSKIDVVFIIEVPAEKRVQRVKHREELRFGSRVMPGGDMYEQQKEFRDIIRNKKHGSVEASADRIHCRKVRLDGTKNIEENIDVIIKTLETIECEG